MNYFLALLPDESANHKIRKVLAEVGALFDANGVPLSLTKPDSLHITIIFIGKKVSFLKKLFLNWKIKKHPWKAFRVSIGKIRLGISRNYRELLFLTIDNGADVLRDTVYTLSPKLKIKRDQIFIPHITLGRVGKDLTDEEFMNLSESIAVLNQRLENELAGIEFMAKEMKLIQSEEGVFKILHSYPANL